MRSNGSTGSATVSYTTADQTALAGTDYTTSSGILSWSDDDTTSKTITVPVSNSTPFTGARTFTVALSTPSTGITLGSPSSTTVTISGDAPPVGALEFSAATYPVAQSAGAVTITVNRAGGSAGTVSINYSTTNATAVAGTDYTTANGQLDWPAGDTTSKTFSVDINDAAPFTGTKSFTVTLSGAIGGATLGAPSTAMVAITGSGSTQPPAPTTMAPGAVGNLQLINQGGTANNTTPVTNIQQISWSPATAGTHPISYYRIYRNGVAYATSTSASYSDNNAPASVDPTYATASTVYSYNVAAVDTQGNEGPKATQMSVYAYRNGMSTWSNSDLSYGTLHENYSSTTGNPQGGAFDISVDFISGGFQPAVHPPQAPQWNLEIGAFNYFTIDVNPGSVIPGNTLIFGTVTRLPPGDIYGWHPGVNIFNYGPAPVSNQWATYKIPLLAIAMGICQFTGSISGTTLTVSAIVSGQPLVDAGGFVTGPGVPSGTYITAYGQYSAIGTFTVAGPGISATTNVPTATLTYQRTSLYKFGIKPDDQGTTMYFNNMGFTAN